jgi:hypothetical protein
MSEIHRSSLRFGEVPEFGPFAFSLMIDVTVPMMNAPYRSRNFAGAMPVSIPIADSEWDRAALAGTRMLIAEECFDALLQMLIDAGAVSKGCAAVMLDRLSAKLMMHASGLTETHWAIRQPELLDQARRFASKAVVMRGVGGIQS